MDAVGHLLALIVTPANAQDPAQVVAPAEAVQEAAGGTVEGGFVDQGYTGEQPAADAVEAGIRLEVVKLEEAKRGFVLLPRRWVVERSFAWVARFRRLARLRTVAGHGGGAASPHPARGRQSMTGSRLPGNPAGRC